MNPYEKNMHDSLGHYCTHPKIKAFITLRNYKFIDNQKLMWDATVPLHSMDKFIQEFI